MKECVVCNKEFEPYRPQVLYCGKECRKEGNKEYFRNRTLTKEQREAKNRQAAEYRKLQSTKDRMKKWNEENKEYLTTYSKEHHSKKMQDPEYREIFRLRSIENRAKQPKTFVDCLVCGKNFQRKRYKRNCSKKCSKIWERQYKNRPASIMSKNLARQLHRAIKRKNTNWSKGMELEGNVWVHFSFTIDEFRERFESLFTKGMTWENMGLWHIDHIKPKASFNQEELSDPTSEDFKKCWALENLQPLWALDNIKKGAKEMKV